jgi:uncharacterized protein (DUF305 family)
MATMVRRKLTVVLALVLTAGCGHSPPTASLPPAPATAPQTTSTNGTDAAWLQLMIPMDEQAVRLVESIPAGRLDPATSKLAAVAGARYRADLAQLRALRTRSGVPESNVHKGHDMPGLMTDADLDAVATARGPELGRLVSTLLREHLAQSVVLCRGERASGADQPVKALAASIERSRAARLAQLPG